MSKKITVKTSYYEVNADVVLSDSESNITVENYAGVNFTASKRENAKHIRAQYEDEGFEVVAIRNMTTTLKHLVDVYLVKASNDAIVNACREYGLEVVEVSDSDTAAETDSEE